jgi:plastocyanin
MAVSEKPRWTGLAALGLLLAGLGPLLMLLAVLIWGLDAEGELPFFLGTAAIAFIASFLVWRFGAWAKIVGILAAILVGMALFWTAFGLAQPSSFFDFMPGILVIPGALLAIVACVMALLAKRRGQMAARPEGGEKRGIQIVTAVVLLAAVVSGALTLFTRSTAEAGDAAVTATLKDFEFAEGQYEVPGGSEIFVRNDDPFFHTFTVDELGIDEGLGAGSSKVIDIPQEPGTYVVYCMPHTSEPEEPAEDDMAATITVT